MNKASEQLNRREFLKQATQAAALALGVTGLLAAAASNASAAIQIGILLGTFGSGTLEARLDAVRACGLDCVQVSLDCAGLLDMPDEIPLEVSGRIRREAAARGITIASVQGTFNMSHPDAEHRRTGLRRLRVLAEACPQLGTSKIHLCTGTRDRGSMWRRHPDNDAPEAWRDMAACVREATDIARQTRVVLAFEPEVNNVVNSAQKARRLLDEIASPFLKITIDPANLFHAGQNRRVGLQFDPLAFVAQQMPATQDMFVETKEELDGPAILEDQSDHVCLQVHQVRGDRQGLGLFRSVAAGIDPLGMRRALDLDHANRPSQVSVAAVAAQAQEAIAGPPF